MVQRALAAAAASTNIGRNSAVGGAWGGLGATKEGATGRGQRGPGGGSGAPSKGGTDAVIGGGGGAAGAGYELSRGKGGCRLVQSDQGWATDAVRLLARYVLV